MDINQTSGSAMNCRTKVRIVYACVGLSIGISVFFVFGAQYHNWDAAIWGLTSGVVAGLTLLVHVLYSRKLAKGLHIEPTRLSRWMLLGCFTQLAGVCGFAVYLTLAITQGQGLQIYGAGYYLTLVWCFMTWKWGFILLLSARRYRNMLYEVYTILPKSERS